MATVGTTSFRSRGSATGVLGAVDVVTLAGVGCVSVAFATSYVPLAVATEVES